MENKAIELFYLFFQGILIFQVLVFGTLFIITHKKDLLYYSLFLLCAAAYFFINAPFTFFDIPEKVVWNSAWYDYVNTPLIIIYNLFYLLFLNSFFALLKTDKKVKLVFRFSLSIIPLLMLLFVLLSFLKLDKQFIFYIVNLITIIPSISVAYIILQQKLPFASLVATGLLFSIAGTVVTVLLNVLRNYGFQHLFIDGYTLFFLRVGILGEMIFYMAAILKKWHYQERQLAVEKIQSQLQIEKLRNKISGELHDDFGSSLSGINMYSYLIDDLLQSGKYEEARRSANIIQRSADEMTQNLSDLVWTINPTKDSFQKLIERLEEYARDMAFAKNMKVHVHIQQHILEIELPIEDRRNIFLLCKEAINNAIKYCDGTIIELAVKVSDGKMEFTVSDNGKGFDTVMVRRGNGLENMQKRADEIGAKLSLQSNGNGGVSVSLQCKAM